MSKLRIFLLTMASLISLSIVSACSIHRPDVQQGNFLDEENVGKLSAGMNKTEVRYLMGTPLLQDPFHANRWDYVYLYEHPGKQRQLGRVTVFFDNDKVSRIDKQDITTTTLD